MSGVLTIFPVNVRDIEALTRHIAFENAHGTARFDLAGLQAWVADAECVLLLAAFEDEIDGVPEMDGVPAMVGCATASIVPEIGYGCVQLNAFCLPNQASQIIARLADCVEQWEHASRARELLAHVSNPTLDQEREWIDSGFERVGTRQRVVRTLTEHDRQLVARCPEGIQIVALRDYPQLADAALKVWNECHRDIPTVIPFLEMSMHDWRRELGLGDEVAYPGGLQIAVTMARGPLTEAKQDSVGVGVGVGVGDGDVVGVSYVAESVGRPGMAGHRFSGVTRSWRGRGICTALKLAAITWAAQNGIVELQASNDETNHEMRAVNRKLGYRESFTIVMMRRAIGSAPGLG